MRVALDTSRYVDFCKGLPEALDVVQRADRILVPLMVLAELRAGFLMGSRGPENEQLLTRFLSSPRVRVLSPDEETTHHYARLFRQLRTQGTPIPVNDLWIAALVSEHRLWLYARDRHFDHLPQLARL